MDRSGTTCDIAPSCSRSDGGGEDDEAKSMCDCFSLVDGDEKSSIEPYLYELFSKVGVECVDVVENVDVVAGSLGRHADFWNEIGACKFVLRVIRHGYVLPFTKLPVAYAKKNHASVGEYTSFVEESVLGLKERGCINEVCASDIEVCSPLGVVDNGKKLRLILDLRYLNKHLATFKFKLEDLRTVMDVFKPGDFLVTFDLKSGYHHIMIAKEHHKYLGFKCQIQGIERYFVFCVLPFGLSSAPYIFTKITKPLLSHWRRQGIRCQMYMDDGSGGHETFEGAAEVARIMKRDLEKAGFLAHPEKCKWIPSQAVQLLGMELDFKSGTVKAAEKRVIKLQKCLKMLQKCQGASAREIARVAGYLLSMSIALGPVCRLRTRAFYRFIEARTTWSAFCEFTDDVREELEFWSSTFGIIHGQPMWKAVPVKAVLTWSDASDTGWGGFCLSKGLEVARGDWPESVLNAKMSSTWRELRGTALVLESLASVIAGSTCVHRSDNQAAVHIITFGSRRKHLQAEALEIHRICMQYGVQITAEWVPREENELADFYSKVVDVDDWQVNPEIFRVLDERWGPHTLDCFASHKTKQLPRYCSKWWNPGCTAVDAFTLSWEGENVWLTPPVHLIAKTWKMLEYFQCHGTIVLPKWVSAPWWPLINNGCTWHNIVKDVVELPLKEDTFLQGACQWNLFGNWKPKCNVLALRVCSVKGCLQC